MIKVLKLDLETVCESLDNLKVDLQRATLSETVDVGARLRAAIKTAEEIDQQIKTEIKAALNHTTGTVRGENFKAALALVETTRFDQARFRKAEPTLYEKFCATQVQERITFEPK